MSWFTEGSTPYSEGYYGAAETEGWSVYSYLWSLERNKDNTNHDKSLRKHKEEAKEEMKTIEAAMEQLLAEYNKVVEEDICLDHKRNPWNITLSEDRKKEIKALAKQLYPRVELINWVNAWLSCTAETQLADALRLWKEEALYRLKDNYVPILRGIANVRYRVELFDLIDE